MFKNEHESSSHLGGDTFTPKGFSSWNNTKRYKMHVRGPNSVHNQCVKQCEDLMMQKQSMQTALNKQLEQTKSAYCTHLNAPIDIVRLLLFSVLPFRGHDESGFSRRKEFFRTFLKFHEENNDNVGNVILNNAPGNHMMTFPDIQKEIANSCSKETMKAILEELGDGYFSILVDESHDVPCTQQMTLILRVVDKRGFVMKHLVGLVHVTDIRSLALKEVIYSLLSRLSLSPSRKLG